jgi:hypothetical protein
MINCENPQGDQKNILQLLVMDMHIRYAYACRLMHKAVVLAINYLIFVDQRIV